MDEVPKMRCQNGLEYQKKKFLNPFLQVDEKIIWPNKMV